MKIHPDVAAAHAQFGGDLEDMQRHYDAHPMTPEPAETVVPVAAYRTDIFENLPNGNLSRLILDAREVRNPDQDWTPLVPAAALDAARAEIERLTKALNPFADTFRQHNDPGVSDLYNEQPVAWHVPLGAYRVAATLSPAVKEPTDA